ncbi:MAG TPA: multiheme c-type cytochrome, partial [Bacteroidota bacterium]
MKSVLQIAKRYLPLPTFVFLGAMFLPPQARRVAFPQPLPAHPKQEITVRDFIGADACASCHKEQTDSWSKSVHARAGGAPNKTTVLVPFDGTPIRFKDAAVIPAVNAKGEYSFLVRQEGRAERRFRVDGVIGKGHMAGGGTQAFLTRYPDGT